MRMTRKAAIYASTKKEAGGADRDEKAVDKPRCCVCSAERRHGRPRQLKQVLCSGADIYGPEEYEEARHELRRALQRLPERRPVSLRDRKLLTRKQLYERNGVLHRDKGFSQHRKILQYVGLC